EGLVELGQGAGPADAPAQVVVEGFVAPEQAAWSAAVVPLTGCGAQLVAQACTFGVFAPPVDQARPGREEGFVDDLDAVVGCVACGGHDQAGVDEAVDDRASRGGAAEDLVELGEGEGRAGAFGGDEVAEGFADQALLLGGAGAQGVFGMAGEGALDAADRVV